MPTFLTRLRYEAYALRLLAFALPLIVIAVFVGVALLAAYDARQTSHSDVQARSDLAVGLLFLLEFGLPPVAGLVAAGVVTGNPALELHLTLRRGFAGVAWRRLALFTLWTALLCLGAQATIVATGYWRAPQPAPLNELTWAAPLLWFIGAGALLALLLGSRVASSALLGMLWLGEFLLRSFFLSDVTRQKLYLFLTLATLPGADAPNAAYWEANRLTLLLLGVLFLLVSALLLRRHHALLAHER